MPSRASDSEISFRLGRALLASVLKIGWRVLGTENRIRTPSAIRETTVFDKPYIAKPALLGGGNLADVLGQNLRDFSRFTRPSHRCPSKSCGESESATSQRSRRARRLPDEAPTCTGRDADSSTNGGSLSLPALRVNFMLRLSVGSRPGRFSGPFFFEQRQRIRGVERIFSGGIL
jgi:hypothetical protein